MKYKVTKRNRIKEDQERFESNRLTILKNTGISEVQRINMWLDLAAEFLEERSENKLPPSMKEAIKADREFYRWWLLEWKRKEGHYVMVTYVMSEESYAKTMEAHAFSQFIEDSFEHNYLTI